jgi:tetratricopeptide (TPR) repeat protein
LKSSPALGAGVDNFAVDYLRDRRSSEEPLYPHSLEARLLGGTGVVGFVLFGGWAAISAWLALAAARSRTAFAGVGAAALAMLAYWIAHGSVDWLWEFPALTFPVVAVVACATVAEESARPIVSSSIRHRLAVVALVVASIASLAALAPVWLAARDTALAVRVWRADSATAYDRLADAARLNRLSDQPYVIAGTVAERRRDWPKAERLFSQALQRNRFNWYSLLERGIANSMTGRADQATRDLEAARALDPREPIIRRVLDDVRVRRRVATRSVDAALLERAQLGRKP